MPSQKRITDIKWFSVFDISTQNNFGDVYIPQNFEPPGYQVSAVPGNKDKLPIKQ